MFDWPKSSLLKKKFSLVWVMCLFVHVICLHWREQVFSVPQMCASVCACLVPDSGRELSTKDCEDHKHVTKEEHTNTFSGLCLWSWLRRRSRSHFAPPGSSCGQDPIKTLLLLKLSCLDESQGWWWRWSGWNVSLSLEVQGYVLLVMGSPCWASLALSP